MAFIYHIAATADWERAVREGQYTTSTRGLTLAEQGFIHASTADQVARVANAFYRDVPDLVLLVIDPERVGPEIRYERVPGQDAPYPHIYGPLNTDAVAEARPFARAPTVASPSPARLRRPAGHDRSQFRANSAHFWPRS